MIVFNAEVENNYENKCDLGYCELVGVWCLADEEPHINDIGCVTFRLRFTESLFLESKHSDNPQTTSVSVASPLERYIACMLI